jgi:hypothetical protein
MRDAIRRSLEKRRKFLEHERLHRKKCRVSGCLVCAGLQKRVRRRKPRMIKDCACDRCNFCRERQKFERIFHERYGAEMAWYYDGLRLNYANTFQAIDRAYYYCHNLD